MRSYWERLLRDGQRDFRSALAVFRPNAWIDRGIIGVRLIVLRIYLVPRSHTSLLFTEVARQVRGTITYCRRVLARELEELYLQQNTF